MIEVISLVVKDKSKGGGLGLEVKKYEEDKCIRCHCPACGYEEPKTLPIPCEETSCHVCGRMLVTKKVK